MFCNQIAEDSLLRRKVGTLWLVIPVSFIYFYCFYLLYLLVVISMYFQNYYILSFSLGRNDYLATGGLHSLM